ncbi:hypothetical protein [Streptomyces sp. ICBB 8177]|uniref:WXG100-like domain-containing protein n=1 Tax=Streptomyces sp. ICBB 8177 TaxID=563922 RepID=UPI000D67D461|nr:hypothetical protein [Streptomyces sp. ICBB 8177]PWI42571.1 hypothetical protein CK485_09545 [Streptomyces sp. ICBB 8177]
MSINLPHWLAEVVNILGFNWPEIDEDQLREAAKNLRSYAQDCESSHNVTHGVVTGDLPQVYAAQSYTALAELWGGRTQNHMKDLIEVCRLLADALDVAALGVEGMKDECLVQLGVAAGELIGDQIGAVFTLGLSEAAAAAEIELQNRLLDGILQRFEQEVVGVLVGKMTGPLKEQVDRAVEKLLFEEVAHLAVGGPPPGLKLDTGAMRVHAGTIGDQVDANLSGGRTFASKMSALSFTTGG